MRLEYSCADVTIGRYGDLQINYDPDENVEVGCIFDVDLVALYNFLGEYLHGK